MYKRRQKTVIKKLFITKCNRSLLQSASGITKCGRMLLQSVSGTAKRCRLLLQNASGITKCGSCERYEISLRIQSKCGKIGIRISPNTDSFHAVMAWQIYGAYWIMLKPTKFAQNFNLIWMMQNGKKLVQN